MRLSNTVEILFLMCNTCFTRRIQHGLPQNLIDKNKITQNGNFSLSSFLQFPMVTLTKRATTLSNVENDLPLVGIAIKNQRTRINIASNFFSIKFRR